MNTFKRSNATFVSLVRNEELVSMMASMRGVEDRVNRKLGTIGVIHLYIDQTKASEKRKEMESNKIINGVSESYRHMVSFFFRHPLMMQFDYYWRVEPGVEYYCDVDYDPFLFMQENKKQYGFTITLYEYKATIESLWSTTQSFIKLNPQYLHPNSALNFIIDDLSQGINGTYNLCHFWSNFEIGNMNFWRSKAYTSYFNYLDQHGGFFYERWGDAPVHSLAAALFLPFESLHQFDDIAYRHPPFMHCPNDLDRFHLNGKCFCDPNLSFDRDGYSCMKQWWRVGGEPK
ncbi:family 15 glycosyltransferase [Melampsora larici-populina 98AG31]|uniref:Family 15 glycosyltransferase n=1 Tax=Melampsora larici-populina (strain 98AG31 / pathotype 3-4-7) TaxID=747676 RepID=F4RCG6_MELLP|nr:family 15 glycosyltransferase [Melampsora larici-populina 98AG31]EGG09728.1 family 15 glycosyltransferase [Melampsora larici-populina 98AG31]